jgi:hypothetical protein
MKEIVDGIGRTVLLEEPVIPELDFQMQFWYHQEKPNINDHGLSRVASYVQDPVSICSTVSGMTTASESWS